MTSLINGLGGEAGFGENYVARNDDGSSDLVDITSVFENGLNFFGTVYTGLYVNNNGSVTFESARPTYTPDAITGVSYNPEISPYFADVDTRLSGAEATAGVVTPTAGGNSAGSDLVWYDLDTANDRFVVTWDDVGYYSVHTDKLNAFQLVLTDLGAGDFRIDFIYEDVQWTTGDASSGSGGLGGVVARAGYTSGNGEDYYEIPYSGNQDSMLTLDTHGGNTGIVGQWTFEVRNGGVDNYNDSIIGDDAADTYAGGDGFDTIRGGAGGDVLYGNVGDDLLYGNTDNDTMFGGRQSDIMFGGQNDDQVYGNFDNDVLYGNFGLDILFGGQDDDTLYGGQDDDTLYGNRGNDVLIGNRGDDLLVGGADADTFVGGSGDDVVLDFETGVDVIGAGGFTAQQLFDALGSDAEGNALVQIPNGSSITVIGIAAGDLTVESFITY